MGGRRAIRLVAEPKASGVRWLVRLDTHVSREYAAAVGPLVPAIEAALPPEVVANRVERVEVDPAAIHLEPWRVARSRFGALVRERAAGAAAALVTDVHDCYGSMAPRVVVGALRRLDAPPEDVRSVRRALARMHAQGVRGLPIGPAPSAVLANAVLLSVDRRLQGEGWPHLRWVDDVIVFLPDAAAVPTAVDAVRCALAQVGLQLSARKTRVLLDPAIIRTASDATSGPQAPAGDRTG